MFEGWRILHTASDSSPLKGQLLLQAANEPQPATSSSWTSNRFPLDYELEILDPTPLLMRTATATCSNRTDQQH